MSEKPARQVCLSPSTLSSVAAILFCLCLLVATPAEVRAATPGLPFTEDFTDASLRDDDGTNANWSTEEQALILAWRQRIYGAFGPGLALSLIHISEPTRHDSGSRMPSSA